MEIHPDISSIYEGTVWRPPSEARSLILQATVGCSWNKCTFCEAYMNKRFRVKSMDEIESDVEKVRPYYRDARRIFLADGNALCMPTEALLDVLSLLEKRFPELERVGLYGGPLDIREKSLEDLEALAAAGLGIVYLGLESGSETVLKMVRKGAGPDTMVSSGRKVKEAGLLLSAIIIQGLGGKGLWKEHANDTASVLSNMDPHYIGALSLMICAGTPMEEQVRNRELLPLGPKELLRELRTLMEGLELTDCVFRANHPSNYVGFGGTLPRDKERILGQIDRALEMDLDEYRPEWMRGL